MEAMGSYDYEKLCKEIQVADWRANWMAETAASRESRVFSCAMEGALRFRVFRSRVYSSNQRA